MVRGFRSFRPRPERVGTGLPVRPGRRGLRHPVCRRPPGLRSYPGSRTRPMHLIRVVGKPLSVGHRPKRRPSHLREIESDPACHLLNQPGERVAVVVHNPAQWVRRVGGWLPDRNCSLIVFGDPRPSPVHPAGRGFGSPTPGDRRVRESRLPGATPDVEGASPQSLPRT